MAQLTTRGSQEQVVVLNQPQGIALIAKPTPLTRLNYYDGKYLRADDMRAEQEYGRRLQQLGNRAGGAGVVDGFELSALAGDQLRLAAGLAIDDDGRTLYMPHESSVGIEDLIKRSQQAQSVKLSGAGQGGEFFAFCETASAGTTAAPIAGVSLYVVGIGSAEALCGQEDVYGKLCEEACVSGTERPWRLEGVVLRALPLVLVTPLPTSSAVAMEPIHLRSRVASAFFADEAREIAHLISSAGLQSKIWCAGAAASSGAFVPLGLLARAGGHTSLLDLWTARRERIDSHPRRYWQWRMMMRPWDVYLGHILQFQCQLRDVWQANPPTDDDPCDKLKRTVLEVSDLIGKLERQYRQTSDKLAERLPGGAGTRALKNNGKAPGDGATASLTLIDSMARSIQKVQGSFTILPSDRVLIRRGIVELPSAGYLPVAPGSAITVNEQVRRLMGEGVDLRFCVVRPDFVAHALEEAQHMERISLLRGLDNQAREEVDILVPDGVISDAANTTGVGWEVRVTQAKGNFDSKLDRLHGGAPATLASHADALERARANALGTAAVGSATQPYARDVLTGAARSEVRADGSLEFVFAGLAEIASRDAALSQLKKWAGTRDNSFEQTLWHSVDLMTAAPADVTPDTVPAAGGPRGRSRAAKAGDSADIAGRFVALRTEALDHRLKTLARVADTATAARIAHFAGLKDGADNDHLALWLALRARTNPLAVAEGGVVGMSMSFSLLMPKAAGTNFVDIDIVGAQLHVESRVTTGQRVAVQGSLRGAAIVRGLIGTLANAQRGITFNAPVIITAEPSAQGTTLVVEVDFSAALFDGKGLAGLQRIGVRVGTSDTGKAAKVLVALGGADSEIAFGAGLARSDSVLKLGHPLRTAAETAIEVLATRESAPNFASEAAADLFGQRPPAQDALTIHAKHDWVLFHRRRNKQCGSGPTVQPVEERRYQLFHLRARSVETLRSARAAVISANASKIAKFGFAPIGAAAFDGGRSSLATPTAALLADWDAAQPGNRIGFGAIGSQGAAQAEGDALARARLATLEQVLARGELVNPPENQILPVLPDMNLAGWDGAVFLITLQEATVCHDVYRIRGSNLFGAFLETVAREGFVAARRELRLSPFAHVDFEADAKTIQPQSQIDLRAAWGNAGKPMDEVVGFFLGDSAESNAVKLQSQAIMGALQGHVSDVFTRPAADLKEATDCRGITVVVMQDDTPPPPPPPVTTSLMLLAFEKWDDHLRLGAGTNVDKVELVDGNASDPAKLQADLRLILARSPGSMTAAVPNAADMATANAAKDLIEGAMQAMGGPALPQRRTDVLKPQEIQGLAALGFPPGSYASLVYFTPNQIP